MDILQYFYICVEEARGAAEHNRKGQQTRKMTFYTPLLPPLSNEE